ncbi:uncharacterized protein LOC116347930 isoform X1 [Contarinia nasturtii]|uniref:uncharacterized protein LOC116347930 isoform X1 n=1 Tax=Contarinia nasturtii TaxID=265458 RepID=UPI0012D44CED|nr:uncharacterized protein LOC116347930 isoform X1 [Contarinia nasturtii]
MKFYNKIGFYLVFVWTIIEITLCIIVLCTREHNYTDNFLNGLCKVEGCGNFIQKALIGRLLTLISLLFGNLTGCHVLMVPWFLVNAIGVFPLLPLIVSSYYRYKEVKEYETCWRIIKWLLIGLHRMND